MAHPNPSSNQSFFNSLPPNPNPNPSFSYSLLHSIQPPPPPPPPPNHSFDSISFQPSSNGDLQSTLSILKHFTNLAETTVNSVSELIFSGNRSVSDDDLCHCPFDVRHRMPPEFLFRHFLRCPSSPCVLDLDILGSLRYPHSLKSEDELRRENLFVQKLQESDADLCFSLDDYGDSVSNFFYRDCPGVVSSSDQDNIKRTFTLPGVLAVECANFVVVGDRETRISMGECPRILPSELLALRSELDVWSDYPSSYSFTVLRVALCLEVIKESDLLKWIISKSPMYGVVIDAYVRNHIFLLLKLCLKAISREAFHSSKPFSTGELGEQDGYLNPKNLTFKCPVLVQVLSWLASQLSVLYGEVNGKFFSVNMLKHCLSNAASASLLFPLGSKFGGSAALKENSGNLDARVNGIYRDDFGSKVSKSTKHEVPCENSGNLCDIVGYTSCGDVESKLCDSIKIEEPSESKKCQWEDLCSGQHVRSSLIFVSQVAAAVAALHERSLLEERIKGLRLARLLSRHQLLAEHSYISTRADEERRKRPNYRPIIEHDGLLWQRSSDKDGSKSKTREELLAEERDYKRRRMSYRGKKLKRTTTQVMRDIIEEHMEAIKRSGGIGNTATVSAEGGMQPSDSVFSRGMTKVADELKNGCDLYEQNGGNPHGRREHDSDYNTKPKRFRDATPGDHRQDKHEHGHHDPIEDRQRISGQGKRYRQLSSRSPEKYRSHVQPHQQSRYRNVQDDVISTRREYGDSHRSSSHRSKYDRYTSSGSNYARKLSDGKYDRMSDIKDRRGQKMYGHHQSETITENVFEDRYDPQGSYSTYEDHDASPGSKYV